MNNDLFEKIYSLLLLIIGSDNSELDNLETSFTLPVVVEQTIK